MGNGAISQRANVVEDLLHLLMNINEDNEFAKKMDKNTRRWTELAKHASSNDRGNDSKIVHYFPEKDMNRSFIVKLGLPFFTEDDQSEQTFKEEIKNEIIAKMNKKIVDSLNDDPIVDIFEHFSSFDEVNKTLIDVFGTGSLPSQSVFWNYWNNAHTLSNLAFAGLGQYYLTAVNDHTIPNPVRSHVSYSKIRFQIDLSAFNKYAVREGIEKFGAIMYFGDDRLPIGVYLPDAGKLFTMDDEHFPQARAIFTATLICMITLREHLVMVHWIISNAVLINSERFLSNKHPLRRFIKPHTFNAASVNYRSLITLAPKNGLAARLLGFELETAWNEVVDDCLKAFVYESLEERMKKSGIDSQIALTLPLYEDGLEFWRIIEEYVTNFLQLNYTGETDAQKMISIQKDIELQKYWQGLREYHNEFARELGELTITNLIKQLTHFIFWVTGGHTLVGSVEEYLTSPDALCAKITKVDRRPINSYGAATIQTFFQQISLICLTSMRMPLLLNDWSHLYDYQELRDQQPDRYHAIISNLQSWQANLQLLVKKIEVRNQLRKQPFDCMNPVYMNSAVSV